GVGDREQVSLAGLAPGTYYLLVYSARGAANPDYTLTVTAPQTDPLAPDWAESPVPNNDLARATDLGQVPGRPGGAPLPGALPGPGGGSNAKLAGPGAVAEALLPGAPDPAGYLSNFVLGPVLDQVSALTGLDPRAMVLDPDGPGLTGLIAQPFLAGQFADL